MVMGKERLVLGVINFLNLCQRATIGNIAAIMFYFEMLQESNPVKPKFPLFGFHPSENGPESFWLEDTLEHFVINKKWLIKKPLTDPTQAQGFDATEEFHLTDEGRMVMQIKDTQVEWIQNLCDCYATLEAMTTILKRDYPNYVYNYLSPYQKNLSQPFFLTMGYEGRPIDTILGFLLLNRIDILVDIRINNNAQRDDLNLVKLKRFLSQVKIKYEHWSRFGNQFRKHPDWMVRYHEYIQSDTIHEQIKNLLATAKGHRIALMCFEANVLDCHRLGLAKILEERGAFIFYC